MLSLYPPGVSILWRDMLNPDLRRFSNSYVVFPGVDEGVFFSMKKPLSH